MPMRQRIRQSSSLFVLSAVALAALVGGGLGGCSGSSSSYSGIKSNLTPELDTLWQRPTDVDNDLVLMDDENWRMFREDLGRAFYVDRPSRLSPEPNPR